MARAASKPAPATLDDRPESDLENPITDEGAIRVQIPEDVRQMLRESDLVTEDLELESVEVAEPTVPPKKEPPKKPVAAKAPSEPVIEAPVIDPALRAKASAGARTWEEAEQEIQAAKARSLSVPGQPAGISDEAWATMLAEVKAEVKAAAASSEDFGAAGEAIAEKMFTRLREIDKARTKAEAHERWCHRMLVLEEAARSRYTDFDDVMTAASLWDATPDDAGRFKNPILGRRIYSAIDPPETAYWIGRAILAKRAGKTMEEVLAEQAEGSGVKTGTVAAEIAKPPAKPTPVEIGAGKRTPAEAARAATRETVDRIAENSHRPRGLRGLTPAAEPEGFLSLPQLDALQHNNPDAYRKLIEANPKLDKWHMSGGLLRE